MNRLEAAVKDPRVRAAVVLLLDWAPIRKVVVGALASLALLVATHAGLDFGSDAVNDGVVWAVGAGAAYLVRDPRVKSAKDDLTKAVTVVNNYAPPPPPKP